MKIFSPFLIGDVTNVQLFKDENEKPRGCGLVTYSSAEGAKMAVDIMHNFELESK